MTSSAAAGCCSHELVNTKRRCPAQLSSRQCRGRPRGRQRTRHQRVVVEHERVGGQVEELPHQTICGLGFSAHLQTSTHSGQRVGRCATSGAAHSGCLRKIRHLRRAARRPAVQRCVDCCAGGSTPHATLVSAHHARATRRAGACAHLRNSRGQREASQTRPREAHQRARLALVLSQFVPFSNQLPSPVLRYVNHHAVANGMPVARAGMAAKRGSGPGKPWVTSFSRKLEWTYVENQESIGQGSFGIVRTATYVPSSPPARVRSAQPN